MYFSFGAELLYPRDDRFRAGPGTQRAVLRDRRGDEGGLAGLELVLMIA